MTKYIITAHKQGMRWKTPVDEQETKEGVQDAMEFLILKGFTYITIQTITEDER